MLIPDAGYDTSAGPMLRLGSDGHELKSPTKMHVQRKREIVETESQQGVGPGLGKLPIPSVLLSEWRSEFTLFN